LLASSFEEGSASHDRIAFFWKLSLRQIKVPTGRGVRRTAGFAKSDRFNKGGA
jgi:hypothetical protein